MPSSTSSFEGADMHRTVRKSVTVINSSVAPYFDAIRAGAWYLAMFARHWSNTFYLMCKSDIKTIFFPIASNSYSLRRCNF